MIKPIDYSPWIVTKGGALMATDCRERAIQLMAQLAFNLVAAQVESPIKESDHAVPIDRP